MQTQLLSIVITIICLTGCGAVGSTSQTSMSTNVVEKWDQTRIQRVSVHTLQESFLNRLDPSLFAGEVVEITGTVVAFELTPNNLYTVTIREDDIDALCIFDDSISGQLGDKRPVRSGATLTIQGQCHTSGLFSSNPFTLDGCRIVTR